MNVMKTRCVRTQMDLTNVHVTKDILAMEDNVKVSS